MAEVTFDVASFRTLFPEFANSAAYPDDRLQSCFDQASCFIRTVPTRCLSEQCLTLALNLMTAHLCAVADNARQGKPAALITSSSVGSVSVGATAPPFGSSQWAWWLNTTAYGPQLQALLGGLANAGFYFGSRCERQGFRKIGGGF